MSLSRNQITKWVGNIDLTGKTVLDVGAGDKTRHARNWAKGEPKKYVTLDIDKKYEPDIVMDLNEDGWLGEEFDIVFCLETLEHVWNPINATRILADMTKKDGTCYISVPFINPIHDEWDMLRFTDEWFMKVLPEVGFREVIVERRVATVGLKALQAFYSLEGLRLSRIRADKGEGHKIADIGYIITARK